MKNSTARKLEQIPTGYLIMGVDPHKKKHAVVAMTQDAVVHCKFKVVNSRRGYEELLERSRSQMTATGCRGVMYAIEAASHFWRNLAYFLEKQGVPFRLINPFTLKRRREGRDGVPVPHPDTYPGLVMAFELAAQGKSDGRVAQALNVAGYRTVGNRGSRPFSSDTVRGMVTNKFYIGLLPDGNGGWIEAQHEPFTSRELWNQVQQARERNRKGPITVPKGRSISSLTGLAFCAYCKGRINIAEVVNGRRRMACSTRAKGWECSQKSAYLDIYESQLEEYLRSFHIPEDYREKIVEAHRKLQVAYDDIDSQRARLEMRLGRLKELYGWGDIAREEYLTERDAIRSELAQLSPLEERDGGLDKLAQFLTNVADAWHEANQEQRNGIARCLFQEVWIKDREVIAVKPQPELRPFFDLNYEEMQRKLSQDFGKKRPRWDSNPRSSA